MNTQLTLAGPCFLLRVSALWGGSLRRSERFSLKSPTLEAAEPSGRGYDRFKVCLGLATLLEQTDLSLILGALMIVEMAVVLSESHTALRPSRRADVAKEQN